MINLFSPLRTVMIFLIFGFLWIFTTEFLLRALTERFPTLFWHGHYLKGVVFVSNIGLFLYRFLNKYLASLYHSENAYIRIFSESPHAMWIYNKEDLRILLVNDAAVNTYGYSRQEFLKMHMTDLNPKGDGIRYLKKDGSLMYVQVQSFGTSYKGEEAEVVSAMDVTDKYLADETLHQHEKLLNTIINSTDALVWAVNAEKQFIAFNQAFHDTIMKFTGTDIKLGDDLAMVEGELEYQRWRKHYEKSLRGERLMIEEARELEGIGLSWSEVAFTPIVFEGNIIGVACFARNITERKQQEIQLKNAVERYEIVSLATNDVIWDWDLATNKVLWNSNLQLLFGHDASNEDISWWKKMVHPDDYARAVFSLEEVIRTRLTQWEVEYRFMNAWGEYRYVSDRGYVIYNEEGLPYRVIGAMQDIDEKKKFVEELKKVAHMSSHGMRRPVASMLGLVGLMNKENLADPANAPLLVHVEKLAEEMDVILHEVADRCNAIFMEVQKE